MVAGGDGDSGRTENRNGGNGVFDDDVDDDDDDNDVCILTTSRRKSLSHKYISSLLNRMSTRPGCPLYDVIRADPLRFPVPLTDTILDSGNCLFRGNDYLARGMCISPGGGVCCKFLN